MIEKSKRIFPGKIQMGKISLESDKLNHKRNLYLLGINGNWEWRRWDHKTFVLPSGNILSEDFKLDYLADKFEIERLLELKGIKIVDEYTFDKSDLDKYQESANKLIEKTINTIKYEQC